MRAGLTGSVRALIALVCAGALGGALAAGCGHDQSIVGGSCAPGYTQCGDLCVNLDKNQSHCGACGNVCPPGVECVLGGCGGQADGEAFDVADSAQNDDSNGGEAAPVDGPAPDAASDTAPGDMEAAPGDTQVADGPVDGSPSDSLANEAEETDGPSPDDTGAGGPADVGVGGDGADGASCAPLAACGGQCVDTTNDPANCGACAVTCYSLLCQNSKCLGETTGAIVLIGHDYATYSQAQARVLSNAVFLPQASQTLPVLSYERYANAAALSNVKSILSTAAMNIGRTLALTSTTTDSDVTTGLTINKYGTLLVVDQPAATSGSLATLGATWLPTLSNFTQSGGVVVVLDGDTGVQEMPQFVTATGLLNVTAQALVPPATPLSVVARADAVALGVGTVYGAASSSTSLSTEPSGGNVVYVVVTPGDAGTSAPVVVHKVF
jgi:hypothetical protein